MNGTSMNNTELELVIGFVQARPDSAARELEQIPIESTVELLHILPLAYARKMVVKLLPPYAARVCAALSADFAAQLFAQSQAAQLAPVMRCIPKEKRKPILQALPEKLAAFTKVLLSYAEDSVGAWMTANILMLHSNTSASDALERLVEKGLEVDTNAIPLVNDQRKLLGTVDVRDLLRAPGDIPVGHLDKKICPAVNSRMRLVEVAKHEGWAVCDTLAVENHQKQLIGVISQKNLRRRLLSYSEIKDSVSSENLLNGIGNAYSETIGALIGLVGEDVFRAKENKETAMTKAVQR